jgi:SNF2 family DNA or RNA helicase
LLEAQQAIAQRNSQKMKRTTSDAEADLLDAFHALTLNGQNQDGMEDAEPDLEALKSNASVFDIIGRPDVDIQELMQGSVKLRVLLKLVRRLHREGHRMLIFSQSKLMLDIVQRVMAEFGMSSCRIDGSVTGKDRQRIIDNFNDGAGDDDNDDNSDEDDGNRSRRRHRGPSICLLTTRACGYGITLTGADRVIVFDPR